jgi:hypothetical protein
MNGEGVVFELMGALGDVDENTRAKMAAAALAARDAAARPADGERKLLTMTEVCREVRRSPSWGARMGISHACGIRFGGGRPLFDMEQVRAYLSGPAAVRRREELRLCGWGRKARESVSHEA